MIPILVAAERGRAWAMRLGLGACLGFFLSSAHAPIFWGVLRHGPQSLLIGIHCLGLLVLWWISRRVLERQSEIVDRR
jgi:threonine/homoserine/homoserine lactone efflux protein